MKQQIHPGPYVHGYERHEARRLEDQALALADLLHHDTAYPEGHEVLEAGCGVGAQTVHLARNSPGARITSIDVRGASVAAAGESVRAAGLENVTVRQADIFDLPFAAASFDHVFLCFVLEHLPRPLDALHALKRVLKPGGTLTAIEGDHGSAFFHPDSALAREAVAGLVALQAKGGGNALIGRELYPLLGRAGFDGVRVSPRMVYADASRPALVEGFTKKTFAAMIAGVREPCIAAGMMAPVDFDRGVADLYRTAAADGVFCYTFFKATARCPAPAREASG